MDINYLFIILFSLAGLLNGHLYVSLLLKIKNMSISVSTKDILKILIYVLFIVLAFVLVSFADKVLVGFYESYENKLRWTSWISFIFTLIYFAFNVKNVIKAIKKE
jgi:TRAP-type C4-dicarboxylate transport system permease small subunit